LAPYIYFSPLGKYTAALRLDTTGDFYTPASWEAYVAFYTGITTVSYSGASTDGKYIYYAPWHDQYQSFSGKVLRYDPTGPSFNNSNSWTQFNAGVTDGLSTIGFTGSVFDGKYIYFSPWGQATLPFSGNVLRYCPNFVNGSCGCPTGVLGVLCNECLSGYYSSNCSLKCQCVNGICFEGVNGNGNCACNTGYTGIFCDTCNTGYYSDLCLKCSCVNGTCLDGKTGNGSCLCFQNYSGTNCDQVEASTQPSNSNPSSTNSQGSSTSKATSKTTSSNANTDTTIPDTTKSVTTKESSTGNIIRKTLFIFVLFMNLI